MATDTLSEAVGNPITPMDVDTFASEAIAISNAIHWIVEAQDVLSAIRHRASCDPALAKGLDGISYSSPFWSGMADAIGMLSLRQQELIRTIEEANRG